MNKEAFKAAREAGFKTGVIYYSTDMGAGEDGYRFAQPISSGNCLVELEKLYQKAYEMGLKAGYQDCLDICHRQDEPNTEYRYDYRRGVLDCYDNILSRSKNLE